MSWFLAEFSLIFLPICYFQVDFEDLGQFYFVCLFFILGGRLPQKKNVPISDLQRLTFISLWTLDYEF